MFHRYGCVSWRKLLFFSYVPRKFLQNQYICIYPSVRVPFVSHPQECNDYLQGITFAARLYPVCDININSKPQCVLHCGGCSIIFLNFVRIIICIPHINHAYMLCGNWLNDCILFIIDHVQEYFTRKKMSPVPLKGRKLYTYARCLWLYSRKGS